MRLKTQSRYNVVQIEVSFVSTGRDRDKAEKVNISPGYEIQTSLNLLFSFTSRGLSFRGLCLDITKN